MSRLPKASRWALLGCLLIAHLGCAGPRGERATITVAAASSLTAAMEEVTVLWNDRSGIEMRCAFGASSTLVRQIERGAPYDILLSANEGWVDYLIAVEKVGVIDKFPLARNELVVVAPASDEAVPEGSFFSELSEGLFETGRWALGDPEHVPVGLYAKQALENLGFWDELEGRIVPASNARAALRLVERGEVDYGIVYRTDMLGSDAVRAVVALPFTEVQLTGCLLRSEGGETGQGAAELHEWLQGEQVREVLSRHGFRVVGPAPSLGGK